MEKSAFIGVSLDSSKFSRKWVRNALEYILQRHCDLTLLLADRLLCYNKTVSFEAASPRLSLVRAHTRIEQRRNDIHRFLKSEIGRLIPEDQARVHIAQWDDYSDREYVNVLRLLNIAYLALPRFARCVDKDAEVHFTNNNGGTDHSVVKSLSVAYILDETAMDIRIAEIGGRPFDYYPVQQINTLRSIYAGEFAADGLTVESLTGLPIARKFTQLSITAQAASV